MEESEKGIKSCTHKSILKDDRSLLLNSFAFYHFLTPSYSHREPRLVGWLVGELQGLISRKGFYCWNSRTCFYLNVFIAQYAMNLFETFLIIWLEYGDWNNIYVRFPHFVFFRFSLSLSLLAVDSLWINFRFYVSVAFVMNVKRLFLVLIKINEWSQNL